MKESAIVTLVIGADHQNTLGVIRALGFSGIVPHLIIHSTTCFQKIRCFKSKYARGSKTLVRPEEELVFKALLDFASKEKHFGRIPVIPTDDFVEYVIDCNLNELKEFYLLPSFSDKQGKVVSFMDKYEQYKIISTMNIPIAKTELVHLNCDYTNDNIAYPIILKPAVSAFGRKGDITIAHNREQYLEKTKTLIEKGYSSILIQEFIDKEYEMCTFGCITPNSHSVCLGTLKKLRYYPYSGGSSLSYAQFVKTPKEIFSIIDWMKTNGYSGLFDIETFKKDNQILINEINFRNSGNTWALVREGINTPLFWVYDVLGLCQTINQEASAGSFFMNETSDLHHLIDGKITLFSWLRDLCKTKSFNKFWIKDLRGSFPWYRKHREQ